MRNIKIKGLLFDLDGVLVSTEYNHFLAWKSIADQYQISFNELDNERLKGMSRVDSLKIILQLGDVWISEDEFNDLLHLKNERYLNSIRQLSQKDLLPGVLALLNQARSKNIPCGLGSSSKNAKAILSLVGIESYFDVLIDGNMVEHPKPHPEVFLNGAKQLGLSPNQIIVFEDAESGVKAAKDGGFYVFAVGNLHIQNSADAFVSSLLEFNLDEYV